MHLSSLCYLPLLLSLHLHLSSTTFTFSPSIRCATSTILPTPSYNLTSAVFTACTEAVINGPLAAVYAAILDFRQYYTWNSFVISVAVPDAKVQHAADVYEGMKLTMTTRGLLGPLNSTSDEAVTVLAPEYGGDEAVAVAAWRFDDETAGLMMAEHPNILTDLGNGSVRYVSFETYHGGGSYVTDLLLKSNLQKQFEVQAADLKRHVEANVGSSGA